MSASVITMATKPEPWTPHSVEACLAEAASTLTRLPNMQVCGHTTRWPDIRRPPHDLDRPVQESGRGGPPSGAAIDRMDATLGWLRWLEPDDRRLVWDRACGVPWKILAHRHGMTRTTAWRHWVAALLTISRQLNNRRNN